MYVGLVTFEYLLINSDLVSPLVLKPEVFEKVVTVVDSNLSSSTEVFAVRPCTNSATVFLSGQDILAFLQRLETDNTKIKVIDFASLSSDAPSAPITKAPAPNKKADAKIEDAHQLAIGVKKEVDFASWYTNVRSFLEEVSPQLILSRSWSNQKCSITTTLADAIF